MKYYVCFLLLAAAASRSDALRIVGGDATTIEEYPSIVSMERFRNTVWSINCAGNILTSRWIITAAHCVDELPQFVLGNRRIRAGSTYREVGGEVRMFTQIIKHPEFDVAAPFDADIALGEVEVPLPLSNVIATVSIPPAGYVLPDGSKVNYAGWGSLKLYDSGSDILRQVSVYSINREVCQASYLKRPKGPAIVTENMICAGIEGIGGKDACGGDSGGPMYVGNVLVGVISWGEGCASAAFPGVNVKLSSYTDWILQTAV